MQMAIYGMATLPQILRLWVTPTLSLYAFVFFFPFSFLSIRFSFNNLYLDQSVS